jgi:hypothetical protein
MALSIPRSLVEFILLGPEDDRRQLQDSPILGDVWVGFAKDPGKRLELLITPDREHAAALVATTLRKTIAEDKDAGAAKIAYLQGIVAARLTFDQVLRFVLPMTFWWGENRIERAMQNYLTNAALLVEEVGETCRQAENWLSDPAEATVQDFETRRRFSVLAALLLWAVNQEHETGDERRSAKEQTGRVVRRMKEDKENIVQHLIDVVGKMSPKTEKPLVWTVSLNRRATAALTRSVPAVKADAARTLFKVDCSQIVWAILDSGIDAAHYAFTGIRKDERDDEWVRKRSRIRRSFDFTTIREIVTLDNLNPAHRSEQARILQKRQLCKRLEAGEIEGRLEKLAHGAEQGYGINWELIEELVELNPLAKENAPSTNHGTHVAGILAASLDGARQAVDEDARKAEAQGSKPDVEVKGDWTNGLCPDINLWDFRVLAPSLKETEFAIIAALQYVRYVNERFSYTTIHGANLSLSIPHDVRNFACGRTPICNECERLVNSGVVVVAAAGNRGYQNFETSDGLYEGYAAFSVTDPGNADGVITVGATHRYWPHTYGVSFFSSRGPTGDGRLKPDLVAPGEKIRAPLPRNLWGDLDGTSMAAPHVSGAAAMLMARYSELVGQPRRIKEILCKSATDLARERSFQGHGMLDVLRAFQSI